MSHIMRPTVALFLACTAITGRMGIAVVRQVPASNETACASNLKQVGLALLMYVQDYDEKLPPMQSMAGTQKRLQPYIKNMQLFTCPATSKLYKTNPVLGGKPLAVFAEPAKTVTFYDAAPHADGTYAVAYLDGHVIREVKVPALTPKFAVKKALLPSQKPRKHNGPTSATHRFQYHYSFDPKGQRYWSQLSKTEWQEKYDTGLTTKFRILGRTTVAGDSGVTAEKQDGTGLIVFIPDKGSRTMRLLFHAKGEPGWASLGPMTHIE